MFIIYENNKEIETCQVDPFSIFPKEYAKRFVPFTDNSMSPNEQQKETDVVYTINQDGSVVKTNTVINLTEEELFKDTVPAKISMRQARLALLGAGLLVTVTDAIATGTDETLKIEWEYATEVERDWTSLIAMATALGLTELQLDNLFIEGAKI